MLPPASKNVATGGPFGSNGKPSVGGSSWMPPLPAPNAALVSPPAPAAPPAPPSLAAAPPCACAPPPCPAPCACAPPPCPPPCACAPPPCPPPCPWRPPRPPPLGGPLLARIQVPEKSGLPSAVRGVGAVMITLPCASRGTPAS